MTNEHEKTSGQPPVNEGRRKLTKAGLAVPAVLGTLASKPVLARVPWKCTVSGQTSGNVSGHESESCANLGQGRQSWFDFYNGKHATEKLSVLFSGLPIYFYWDGLALTANPDPDSDPNTNNEATVAQILNPVNAAPAGLEYAQKAVVLLINAQSISDPTVYPLTEFQARNLYVAAATGGHFLDVNPPVDWDNEHVKDYIDLLYRP